MGWTKNYQEEIDEVFIGLMKDRHYELGLDEFCVDEDDLDDLITPYYWLEERRGTQIAHSLAVLAQQIVLERRLP